jgi:tRNA-methyltransferase O
MSPTVPLPVIGVVRTGHRELETTPIQAGLNRAEHGSRRWASSPPGGHAGSTQSGSAWCGSGVAAAAVEFAGVDLLDGTPVLDVKPYVRRFDHPAGEPRCGWFDQITITDAATPAQLAAERDVPPAS